MNITIKEKKENKLLNRTEITASMVFEGSTPCRQDVQKEIAKLAKTKEDLTIIKEIQNVFGTCKATINANAYENEDAMFAVERKNLVEKHAGREAKKAEGEE
jgi:small subunit ribosomal protein S24e